MSVVDALMIMLAFGTFVVSLVALIVTIMKLILDNKK
ncbi:putative holin-like toxin [Loigolactobacillus coryniformis]|uniref:Putative holin-like toxin n=1 Tax=Loigolactobacillus coryniformis TaxID=1610 RepID=A0A5B8TQ28_9LACO|nr:putative holin-like toxin [Loigolactobacillus coryniformis]RRG02574.1 MAG: putative holin-like toxin [Lactobacillus sp.]